MSGWLVLLGLLWGLLAWRYLRARRSGAIAPRSGSAGEDAGPLWSPFRDRGF